LEAEEKPRHEQTQIRGPLVSFSRLNILLAALVRVQVLFPLRRGYAGFVLEKPGKIVLILKAQAKRHLFIPEQARSW
jgi:hypothetical protein